MKLNVTRKTAVILVVTAFLVTSLNAQERNDVIKAYNEGAKSMKTDYQLAITSFETVIALSEKVGESADDLKGKAEKVLPGLYFKVAYSAFNEKKPAHIIYHHCPWDDINGMPYLGRGTGAIIVTSGGRISSGYGNGTDQSRT